MLIGAHVSTAGGLANAVERGEAMGADAIQIFNQSPRMWRPTAYEDEDFSAFRAAMAESRIHGAVIHAIYLINPAGEDAEMRRKSMGSLVHALKVGDAIGADGIVIHPGARKGDSREKAKDRAIRFMSEALEQTERCPLLLENTAGSEALIGTGLAELGELISRLQGGNRVGLCLDSCHLHASGYDVCSRDGMTGLVDEIESEVGLSKLRLLHVNDSRDARGSARDRHAAIGAGEIGRTGLRWFLGEPRLAGQPAVLETPGPEGKGPDKTEVALTRRLWREGMKKYG